MIWTLIGIGGLGLSFVCLWIAYKAEHMYFETRMDKYDTIDDISGVIGCIMLVCSVVIITICTIAIICAHTYHEKAQIQKMEDRYKTLVAIQSMEEPVTIQNQLYNDIIEYNSTVRKNKHYANSPWTNWFYSKEWNELEYIEIK